MMQLTKEQKTWVENTLECVESKLAKVCVRSMEKVPYSTVNGVHDDRSNDIGWWTNGFWGGMMWQMYALTKKDCYRLAAEKNEEKLDACFLDFYKLDHDNGFKWMPTSVANYRLTKNDRSRNRGLLAANNLAGRFNDKGEFIRAWHTWNNEDHRGWAIIDCMMNLPLLYWASEETTDPRFAQIANRHADTARKNFVREDGSVNHIVEFSIETGAMVKSYGGQGYGIGSSWTRGQAWGLYGFTLAYLHTKQDKDLATAKKIADYFVSSIPENGLIPVDFRQPAEVTWQDSTAAAIAACGLIELSKLLGEEGQKYLDAAMKMLVALEENNLNKNEDEDNLLEKCTAAYHDKEHEFSIIYGDYYFVEALMKLAGKEIFVW